MKVDADVCFGGAGAGAGSGVAHASFEPQASIPLIAPKPELDVCCGGAGFGGCGVGWERLKAEKLAAEMGAGAAEGFGGGAGGCAETGDAMSKRPPMLLVAGGGDLAAATGGEAAADEKSPQSPPKLSLRGAGAAFAAG